MHNISDLVSACTDCSIRHLQEENNILLKSLENQSPTTSIRGLQIINLQRAIIATGMFAMFDAEIQRVLNCDNGFQEVSKLLKQKEEINLMNRFRHFNLAINVLKHGRGRSYDVLVNEKHQLPFVIKCPDDDFFNEGDVSEVSTLIEIDDVFLRNCTGLINDISKVIQGESK